jgi:hypothetical protein
VSQKGGYHDSQFFAFWLIKLQEATRPMAPFQRLLEKQGLEELEMIFSLDVA